MPLSKYLRLPLYEVRGYPKECPEKVQELFSRAFKGRTESLEMLRWQMEDNPCLKERATSLWKGDALVAYNALTPHPAFLRGKEVYAAVSGTTMADELYPGCSVQLFRECAQQNRDIAVIVGFPNRNSFNITVKYSGHHYVGDVAFWTAAARREDVSGSIREFYSFSPEYESISRGLSESHELIQTRQKDFLDWRIFKKPETDYRCFEYKKSGYIVTDIYTENNVRQLQIVDIIADSEDVMYELLRFALDFAAEQACSMVKLWFTSERYRRVLESCGFEYGEHPFPMTVWDSDLDISGSYITMIDSDIF